jgi:hypothetical protein
VAGQVQADDTGAAGDDHLVQHTGVRGPCRRADRLVAGGPPVDDAVPDGELTGRSQQDVHRGRAQRSVRQVEVAEAVVGELQCQAAVHGAQRGVRGQRRRVTGANVFPVDGDQPHVAVGPVQGGGVAE